MILTPVLWPALLDWANGYGRGPHHLMGVK